MQKFDLKPCKNSNLVIVEISLINWWGQTLLICDVQNHGLSMEYWVCSSVYFINKKTAASETKPVKDAYTGNLDLKQPRDFFLIFFISV